MEWEWSYLFFSSIILLPAFILFFSQKKSIKCSYNLPPGPPGLPFFGNMFELGTETYKRMSVLKQKYGPVLWLKLDTSTKIMVVQTAQAAEELFKNHDISFADRFIPDVNQAHSYYQGSLALAPYGSFWRFQRRICIVDSGGGPPGLPIFGNMFELGKEPYKKMSALQEKYGPVLGLKLGPSTNIMVVQTAHAAAELFKNHDTSFADRPTVDVNQAHNYYQGSLAIGRYGSFWRFQRRICTVEMFVHKKISETVPIRRKCVDNMLQWIEKAANSAEKGSGIEVTRFVFLASFNMLGNLVLSKDLADPESEEASDFFNAMKGIMEWSGIANVSDIFPFLRKFDLQKLRKKMTRDMGKAMEIMSVLLKEREEERKKGIEKRKDFLDVLLEFEGTGKDEPAKLSEHEIKVLIVEMFLAGSETTSSSVEWALTELLRHPEAMAKVKTEVSKVVGSNNKFEESDIENLPYMQAVIKESLRLHPPLPFLIPRETIQDTKFMGYDILKGTQVLVNAWAIGRDPECWDDPMSFKPERFLGSKIDVKGQNYELIPFGAGRRMCVGLPLGHRMMHFALGSLLHEFYWDLPDGVSSKSINMDESMGVTARKRDSLKVIPKKA